MDTKGLSKHSRRELRKIRKLLYETTMFAPSMVKLSDADLMQQTAKLRKKYEAGSSLDELLPEAFATVREAAVRATGLRAYDVQILGGIELYKGRIAEMKTGEGKTLAAAMPSYLMALTGKGVHVVTVNDYLAQRDAADIGRIHKMLGLTVGCVVTGMERPARREAYACDVTYVTNHEIGFDYLRDNMVMRLEDRVLRGLHYCIIDEVDSVLIDEARTPLIISGSNGESNDFYSKCDTLVRHLKRGEVSEELTKLDMLSGKRASETNDYVVDEKNRTVRLTAEGVARVEYLTGIENFSDAKHAELRHHVQMALQARGIMKRDRDYVVKDGQVLLVDSFTGRVMPGRRFSDGLHQAIEAKEKVEIKPETRTLATITYQNFFNKYQKKAGMTGTALTSVDEFKAIYHLDVIEIPTNKPMIRKDEQDVVYLTKDAKRTAIIREIQSVHASGQPVLVGTTTIRESEIISRMLTECGIEHQVLNAKYHAQEAEIISHAGEKNMVTIATNMAGRGTDIKLTPESRKCGGLYIIGTERHEARRIDNQLRGRAGRQGDPGRSRFFLSLEDDVTRLFGSQKMIQMLRAMGAKEDEPIVHKSLSKMIEDAQIKIENNNFGLRKSLMDYDKVDNEQRELFYAQRDALLNGVDITEFFDVLPDYVIQHNVMPMYPGKKITSGQELQELCDAWAEVFPKRLVVICPGRKDMEKKTHLAAKNAFAERKQEFKSIQQQADFERYVLLKCLDWRWVHHINRLEHIRQSIGFVQYGHENSLVVYEDRAYDAFQTMLEESLKYALKLFFTAKVASCQRKSVDASKNQ